MKIIDVVLSKGLTGFYFDDQAAIRAGAKADGAFYLGEPATPGFKAVRQKGESISVMLVLENGEVSHGDCAAVQYSGAGGRDPLFLADDYMDQIREYVVPKLIGRSVDSFKELAKEIEEIRVAGKKLHTAIRYGVSQAILSATALAKKKLMCEVIAEEYELTVSSEPIPIFTQSGNDRYLNADKMIIKEAPILPHALINNVAESLGEDGSILLDYVGWLKKRIIECRHDESYNPDIHIDVYGTIGIIFERDTKKMASYLMKLEEAVKPFNLRIEGPLDAGNVQDQIKELASLRQELEAQGSKVEIVADEWCNTLEDIMAFAEAKAGHMLQIKTPDLGSITNSIAAVLYCKEHNIGAYQGGTCNETDRSAVISAHMAMATGACQILAKPGMGVDEALMIATNEMQRILALRARK